MVSNPKILKNGEKWLLMADLNLLQQTVKGGASHAKKGKESNVTEDTTHTLGRVTCKITRGEEETTHKEQNTSSRSVDRIINTTNQQETAINREDFQSVLL